jgi:hypothetical protein
MNYDYDEEKYGVNEKIYMNYDEEKRKSWANKLRSDLEQR